MEASGPVPLAGRALSARFDEQLASARSDEQLAFARSGGQLASAC